eukprot:112811-Pyramimonas_sp.AAC.1
MQAQWALRTELGNRRTVRQEQKPTRVSRPVSASPTPSGAAAIAATLVIGAPNQSLKLSRLVYWPIPHSETPAPDHIHRISCFNYDEEIPMLRCSPKPFSYTRRKSLCRSSEAN